MSVAKDGPHRVWLGLLDSRKRPEVRWEDDEDTPRRALAHRVLWAQYWGVPPRQMFQRKLTKVCDRPLCVAPQHHVLSGPVSVYRALGWPPSTRKACRRAFRAQGLKGGLGGKWWKPEFVDDPAGVFGPPPQMVRAIADMTDWPVLAVLAAWSEAVRKERSHADGQG